MPIGKLIKVGLAAVVTGILGLIAYLKLSEIYGNGPIPPPPPPPLPPQPDTISVAGRILEQDTKRTISGASIKFTARSKGNIYTKTSASDGKYRIDNMVLDFYNIEISKADHATHKETYIDLSTPTQPGWEYQIPEYLTFIYELKKANLTFNAYSMVKLPGEWKDVLFSDLLYEQGIKLSGQKFKVLSTSGKIKSHGGSTCKGRAYLHFKVGSTETFRENFGSCGGPGNKSYWDYNPNIIADAIGGSVKNCGDAWVTCYITDFNVHELRIQELESEVI